MSEGLNRVLLLGNLAADGEFRVTSGGQQVLKLRLACGERYKDRDGTWKDRTEFVNVTIWGKRAEALSGFLSKGARIFVEGGLRTSNYEDRDGNKRYRTEVVASNIILCGGRGERSGTGGGESTGQSGGQTRGGGYDEADYGVREDDGDSIPF